MHAHIDKHELTVDSVITTVELSAWSPACPLLSCDTATRTQGHATAEMTLPCAPSLLMLQL
jgi:hypothetical protein